MKECLDYIKESGKEIQGLNEEIKVLLKEKQDLLKEKNNLEQDLLKKEQELENARKLANKWYYDYEELHSKYINLESKFDFISVAFASLVPKLNKKVEEDYDEEEFFSEIINNCKRSRW